MAGPQSVHTVYQSVVDDVINGVREAFLDEGMDEQVLQELKQLWDSKLMQSKAIDVAPATMPQQVLSASMGSSQPPQQFPPYPGANRIATQQLHSIPAAHSNSVTHAVSENPPLAHQNSGQLQAQPLNLQGGQVQMIGTSVISAAQQGLIYRNNQMASAQNRIIALPGGQQLALSNDQVLQILSGQAGGSIILAAAKPDQKSDNIQSAVVQLDGVGDSSSDDDDDNDDDDADEDDDANDDNDDDAEGKEEEPLNSGDDVSDADPTEVFDAENVVVCQFDKINRSKNRWKFHLKDGIMNLNGKDYVFQKCTGDAEW